MKKTYLIALTGTLLALSGIIFAQNITAVVTSSDVAACNFSDANKITGYVITSDGGNRFPSSGEPASINAPVNLTLSTEYDHGIKGVYFQGGEQDDMASASNCDGLTPSATKVQLTFKPDSILPYMCDVTCQYQ